MEQLIILFNLKRSTRMCIRMKEPVCLIFMDLILISIWM